MIEKMKVKAIFLDVDGTLISFKTHKIPQTTIDALTKVHEKGMKIIIATGRGATDLLELEAIPYDAVVSLNGSRCVLRNGTEIVSYPIGREDFHTVLHLAEQYGFPLALEVEKGILVNYVNDTVIALSELTKHPVPQVVDIVSEFDACTCCQLCIYCGEEVEKEIMNQLPGLAVSRWNPYFADVNVAGVNKASGMVDVAACLGFSLDESMAFGDGGNDIPMLKAAGIGIAMGGASSRVKECADFITDDVDEDGILHALVHYGIIE